MRIMELITNIFIEKNYYKFILIITSVICYSASDIFAQQLAFPGAEGYGRFTTGGRGGSVIEVTNLNDSGEGSLRAAVDASGARTVVFRVSGTIALSSRLRIRHNDITIAGQTSPGDGICIRNNEVSITADNVIIQYMRFRLGDETQVQGDAINGIETSNVIIDHCSMSWSIDETASFYDNENFTMQWCLISESLYDSYHEEGHHGYGGIWGGMGVTFHHNLFAHHSSRNPRFCGSRYHGIPYNEIVDHRNNVIYNWGSNSAYAGEEGNQNMIANYYKYGPATSASVRNRIVEPWAPYGWWYVEDNYVYGYPDITADNWAGGVQNASEEDVRVYSPHPFAPVLTQTAENAYLSVLADVGAVLPGRDPVDLRIIEEVRTGTATYGGIWGEGSGIIDSQSDVGGWPVLDTYDVPVDDDHDGMADDWELNNGLNPSDPEDRNGDINGDGYTNLENYLNSLCFRQDYLMAPAELQVKTLSQNEIELNWKEVTPDETGFIIERSENDTLGFAEVASVNANDTSYTDSGLSPLTRYFYRICAYHDSAQSIYTNYASAKTLYPDGSPLEAENPLPADNSENIPTSAILSWTAGAGATSHDVYIGTSNPPPFRGNQSSTTFDPHGLGDSTVYYWRIDEVNENGTTTGYLWSFTSESFNELHVCYIKFDNTGILYEPDATGNGNNAYLRNTTSESWSEDAVKGYALEFDGVDDYLFIENNELLNFGIRGFTISFWIKQTAGNIKTPWVSKGIFDGEYWHERYEVYNHFNGNVHFIIADEEHESILEVANTNFITGDWVMITAVRDREENSLKLYANAELQATVLDNTWNISQKGDLYLGGDAEQNNFFTGIMDEVRIYNYAFDSSEVQNLYHETLTNIKPFEQIISPRKLELTGSPNPFNSTIKISYTVIKKGWVTLHVYNILGQKVATLVNERKQAGRYSYRFDATYLASGVYICQLSNRNQVKIIKMVLLK
jgi:pectate lyase